MRERDVEQHLVSRCKARGWLCWKFVSPQNNGVPDRIVVMPGQVAFIELKAPGKRPTKLQQYRHRQLEAHNIEVTTLDTKQAVDAWVDAHAV
jgi:uncharacterized protein (UPF0261 family)